MLTVKNPERRHAEIFVISFLLPLPKIHKEARLYLFSIFPFTDRDGNIQIEMSRSLFYWNSFHSRFEMINSTDHSVFSMRFFSSNSYH